MNVSTESLSLGWISHDLDGYIASAKNAFEAYLSGVEERDDPAKLHEALENIERCIEVFTESELSISADFAVEIRDVIQALIDGQIAHHSDAYQVVIGGVNQLLNYLGRLKKSGVENPAALLVVTNDLRAVIEKPLRLQPGQFEIRLPDETGLLTGMAPVDESLQAVDPDLFTELRAQVKNNLAKLARQPEEQQQALLELKNAYDSLVSVGSETNSLLQELMVVCAGIAGGAIRNQNRLPISARYTLERTIDAVHALTSASTRELQTDWSQLYTELLYCLCLSSDKSGPTDSLRSKYQLDDAIRIDRAELLNLGTPDAESIEVVLDGLGKDIQVLQNALESCAESNGSLSGAMDVASMAANLQYTLQIMQFYSMSGDLEIVVEILAEASRSSQINLAALELVLNKLFDLEASIQKVRAGSGRDTAEITVIEQLQKAVKTIQELCSRCASLDVDRAIKLASEKHIASEMLSALDVVPGTLLEMAGAAKFIQGEQLSGAISAVQQFYAVQIDEPLSRPDVLAARQGCEHLGSAMKALGSYLDALKESNHALVDNLLLEVGKFTGFSTLTTIRESSGENTITMEPAENVVELLESQDAVEQSGKVSEDLQGFKEMPLDAELDDEIVEIFLEEAGEVFETLNENTELLQADRSNEAALAEIRRGYHTLKGSGRMAGAEDVGNAAWAIENLLNRIIDASVECDDLRMGMVAEANQYLPLLVGYFERRVQPFVPALESLVARAELLANSQDANVELNCSLQLEDSKASGPTSDTAEINQPDPAISEAADHAMGDEITAIEPVSIDVPGVIDEASTEETAIEEMAIEETAIEETNSDETDGISTSDEQWSLENEEEKPSVLPVEGEYQDTAVQEEERAEQSLTEVFLQEARLQLAVLVEYCSQAEKESEPELPGESVERALHTVSGGARIAQIDGLALIMTTCEQLVREARRLSCFDEPYFSLVHRAIISLQNFVDNSEQYSGDPSLVEELEEARLRIVPEDNTSHDECISDISSHCSLLFDTGDFLKEWRVSLTPPANCDAMLSELRQLSEDSGREERIASLCQALIAAYECFRANGLHYRAYWALHQAHNNLVDMLDCLAAGQPVVENSLQALEEIVALDYEQAKAVSSDIPPEHESGRGSNAAASKLDREIVSIFLEESADLIEEVELGVSRWFDDGQDKNALQSLLRPLHTLKGGARMAGLESVGDLCHEFEALVQSFNNGDTKAGNKFNKKLQDCFESLTSAFSNYTDEDSGSGTPENVAKSNAGMSVEQANDEKRKQEAVRVPSELLDRLVNLAGETSISRSLVEEQLNEFNYSIDEIESTVERLKEQLRRLEIETEAQIAFRREKVEIEGQEEFDPLEMDRYSQLQQLSKSLVESASDLKDLKGTLRDKTRDIETLLLQQSRIHTELQEGLMQTRTVPISRTIVPRLRKMVRQVSGELDKPVTFKVGSSDGELDKAVIERMVAPLEHVLRNAIDHGIEPADERISAGKPVAGAISMTINREGSDVVLRISDDGRGVDKAVVAKKALEKGLLDAERDLSDDDLATILFSPGFSTASSVTQISGRGVGMDVVKSEIQELGGSVELQSTPGKGTTFVFRLPFTMSMNRALLVSAGGETIAVPLETIEGIVRVSPYELEEYYGENAVDFLYAGHKYDFRYLGSMLNGNEPQYSQDMVGALPVLLVRAEEQLIAYQIDRLLGSREIVVKSLGPQFTGLPGIIGATVLGDGSVVMIADLGALARDHSAAQQASASGNDKIAAGSRERPLAMVVDDSVTVRKVTTRLLERQGLDVVTAKDGLEAMELLEETRPDFMLLDIEMPRLDGFEVVSRVRHDPRLKDLPIIMITSRTGEKHRERALSLGANEFLGKPFQEQVLFSKIAKIVPAIAGQYAVAE